MHDKSYIFSKLIKQHLIPILFLVMGMILLFVNFFNRPVAYASEIVAKVECGVYFVDGNNVETISKDFKMISSIDEAVVEFSNINVQMNSNSRIEIKYVIENISNDVQTLSLDLEKLTMQNFKIEYSLSDSVLNEFSSVNHTLIVGDVVNIKIVISIDDKRKDASLDGCLKLNINSIGETNE